MPRLAVDFIKGINRLIHPSRVREPYVIDGMNFGVCADGVIESFASECLISGYETLSEAPKGIQSIEGVNAQTYLCTNKGILSFDATQRAFVVHCVFPEVESLYAWSYAYVGTIEFFAKRDVGLIAHDTQADTWEVVDTLETVYAITCLLYTSPSPRDRQKSRMPSSA